ncbi:MAG: YggS family pyridoxal phosphate-dependent enzyme [Candidatus Eiseniibacteriota bacterium]
MEPLLDRLHRIRERIAAAEKRSGRPAASVQLLAVTKGFPVGVVREAIALGLREFGESRVQEAEGKIASVGAGARWHLVGHLQTNKALRAVQLFDAIHSVDSERIAAEIAKRATAAGKSPECFVEVNTSGDAAKFGISPSGALALWTRLRELPPLRPAGFMTIGPLAGGAEGARASFRALAAMREEAIRRGGRESECALSMGMSDDFEIAVEEGAHLVRIGSALFGERG